MIRNYQKEENIVRAPRNEPKKWNPEDFIEENVEELGDKIVETEIHDDMYPSNFFGNLNKQLFKEWANENEPGWKDLIHEIYMAMNHPYDKEYFTKELGRLWQKFIIDMRPDLTHQVIKFQAFEGEEDVWRTRAHCPICDNEICTHLDLDEDKTAQIVECFFCKSLFEVKKQKITVYKTLYKKELEEERWRTVRKSDYYCPRHLYSKYGVEHCETPLKEIPELPEGWLFCDRCNFTISEKQLKEDNLKREIESQREEAEKQRKKEEQREKEEQRAQESKGTK